MKSEAQIHQSFEKHRHWQGVLSVCRQLRRAGYQSLLAGGCVRDALLGRQPKDFDVATDASPEITESLFSRAISIGKAFGVVGVPFDGYQVEVTTFRREGPYVDGRHPTHVVFTDACEDARRRDFTINALFFDWANNQLIDYVGGLGDIERRTLRTVGEPHLRFGEDKLRLLRALRFSVELDFRIDSATLKAICELKDGLNLVSQERIQHELARAFVHKNRLLGLNHLLNLGLWNQIFPNWQEVYEPSFYVEWCKAKWRWRELGECARLDLVFASLFYGFVIDRASKLGIDKAHSVQQLMTDLKNLKFPGAVWQPLSLLFDRLFALQERAQTPTVKDLGEILVWISEPTGPTLIDLWALQLKSESHSLQPLENILRYYQQVAEPNGQLPKPWLNGHDLISMGIKPGPRMGRMLQVLYWQQLDGRINTREQAVDWLKAQP